MPPEMSYEDRNRWGSAFAMVDKRSIHSPVNADCGSRRHIRVQFGPLTNQGRPVAVFYELLYFSRMGSATEFTHANSHSCESLHHLQMRFWMALRVIENA